MVWNVVTVTSQLNGDWTADSYFSLLVLLNYPLYLSGTVTITSKPCSGSKRRGIVVKCQFECRQVVGAHKLELLESTVSQAEFLVLLSLS